MSDQKNKRETPRHTNRLIHETSPYLLQHAHNPVDWYPWGEEAFERAQKEDKPVLLSIGYSACHWCHRLREESFENEEIATLINEHFVNVKVDREERPDLDHIYQTVAQLMGVPGGWPLTVFLTPDQQPFYAGTYFPPEDRFGRPGFPRVLEAVAQHYAQEKEKVVQVTEQIIAALQRISDFGFRISDTTPPPHHDTNSSPTTHGLAETHRPYPLTTHSGPERKLIGDAVEALARGFDGRNGGFGSQPKFPQPKALDLFLRHYHATGDRRFLDMATLTLRKMAEGGVYDQLGGGFHRYSVDAHWLVPHFEKMLYDNAQLPPLYLAAYQLTGDEFFARIARETLDYVLREMAHPDGGFYATTDADSEGEEGRFFVWTPPQVFEVLGYREGQILCDYYGIAARGNFEQGTSVLHVNAEIGDLAGQYQMSREEIRALLERGKQQLLAAREQRVRPFRDEKILTAWNGLMVSALAQGAQVLGEARYADAARRAADFVLEHLVREGERHGVRGGERHGVRSLLRYFPPSPSPLRGNGTASVPYHSPLTTHSGQEQGAYLEDYAFFTAGLLDLFEATFEEEYLRPAERLARQTLELFWDEENGGFFFTPADHEALIVRPKDAYDQAVPSGQSVAVFNLLRLYSFTGEAAFQKKAEAVLRRYQGMMAEQPWGVTNLLCAFDFHLSTPQEIVLVAPRTDRRAEDLLRRLYRVYLPNRVLFWLDPAQPFSADASPLLQGRVQLDHQPTVYVCKHFTCARPVTTWEELELLLKAEG